MILIVELPKEKLHNLEFVKPIEDVIKNENKEYKRIGYKNLNNNIISESDKIIISGTSFKDNDFLCNLEFFDWIKNFDKPVLGICGGMHILGMCFNGKLCKAQEIGLTEVEFQKEFLGFKDKVEVYELHNYYVESSTFEVYARSKKCIQAIKHKDKPFYGVLFHPEVRNKDMITNFIKV